jgi:hypothetical protein
VWRISPVDKNNGTARTLKKWPQPQAMIVSKKYAPYVANPLHGAKSGATIGIV